jgi:hypothetical protein
MYLEMALIDTLTGRTFEVGREISSYAGVEDGESWSEGSPTDRVVIGAVPPGAYYLRIAPDDNPTLRQFSYSVRIRRDVPRVPYYLVALLVITVPLALSLLVSHSFEKSRWAESDHAPVESDDDDDE